MFKNYIIIAFRTITKHKVSSLIAILGLALGIASSLILYVFIDYQLSYEDFLPNDSGIKRVISKREDIFHDVDYFGTISFNNYTAKRFKEKIPSIKDLAIYGGSDYLTLFINGELFNEFIVNVSDNFFDVLPFERISGNTELMQSEPNYIILEETFANKYFPNSNPIGQTITIQMEEVYNLTVTGIVRIPKNSHFTHGITAFISKNIITNIVEKQQGENMDSTTSKHRHSIYIKVDPNLDESILINELNTVLKEIPADKDYLKEEVLLEDFKDIHLFSKDHFSGVEKPINMIILLSILSITLLVSSVINCISILTAGSINRTKEVGVRIVMGSSKRDLVLQFLTESIILSFLALFIALITAELFLPSFSKLVFLELVFNFNYKMVLFIFLLTLLIGLITGLYPALYLSKLRVIETLKGKNLLKLGRSKKILVICQFFISTVILVCCLITNNELKRLGKINLGFNSENLIYVFPGLNFDLEPLNKIQNLKSELKDIEGIVNISYTTCFPNGGGPTEENIYKDDNEILYKELSVNVDSDYFKTIEIKPLEGEIKVGTIVVMESVRKYRDINVGDVISFGEDSYTVGAIIKDYYLNHVLSGDSPKFHIIKEDNFYFQIIRFNGKANLKEIKRTWNSSFPNKVVELQILNTKEWTDIEVVVTVKKVINLTMVITMFISILGLFGLILHSVQQKNKEIGIRKVLGANVLSVVRQFLGNLMKYVVIGVLLGIPTGSYIISFGLKEMGYPFVIQNLFQISILSGFIIIIVGSLLTFLLVLRSATSNPSNALRYE